MTSPAARAGGDVPWRILLTAESADAVDADVASTGLDGLALRAGWTPPSPPLVAAAGEGRDDALRRLRRTLAVDDASALAWGVLPHAVVLSADHGACDGLGLLDLAAACGLGPVASDARGVEGRPASGSAALTIARRLLEAAVSPPAGIPVTSEAPTAPRSLVGETMVARDVAGEPRTADLVHAATQAVVDRVRRRGGSARHVAIAVGAGRPAAAGDPPADRSALLRLRDVERLDRDGVRAALRSAPLQTPPTPGGPGAGGRVATAAMRRLAPRLGSTLLVSHLGRVSAPGLTRLTFHPVTVNGSGVSLGAVSLHGRTTLTLRARASTWNDDGLEQLLEAVISLL